jgi:hypothetical protein
MLRFKGEQTNTKESSYAIHAQFVTKLTSGPVFHPLRLHRAFFVYSHDSHRKHFQKRYVTRYIINNVLNAKIRRPVSREVRITPS